MIGTILITLILISIVAAIVTSMIKEKRKGHHPSCGGSCSSCGHTCNALYPRAAAFLEEQKKLSKNKEISSADNNNKLSVSRK